MMKENLYMFKFPKITCFGLNTFIIIINQCIKKKKKKKIEKALIKRQEKKCINLNSENVKKLFLQMQCLPIQSKKSPLDQWYPASQFFGHYLLVFHDDLVLTALFCLQKQCGKLHRKQAKSWGP